jgi:DNA-binding Lrp family transcriptional regulator
MKQTLIILRSLDYLRFIILASAYVLVNAEIGSESEVLEKLRMIPEVMEAHVVYGVYDIIVRVEADTMESLKDVINMKIRRLDKVRSTITMIVM